MYHLSHSVLLNGLTASHDAAEAKTDTFLILYTKKHFLRTCEFFEISFYENSYEIFYEKIVFKILSSWNFLPF